MKKIILAIMLILSMNSLVADEINIKFTSYVKHHFAIDGIVWNEGFKNSAKGIEYIHDIDDKNGFGLTYITFVNSFYKRTNAGGFVYKRTFDKILRIEPNIKAYALYQKGYYGTWDSPQGYNTGESDNEFWTPLVSIGFEYENFTIDIVGTHKTLHAVTLGYSIKLKGF